MSTRRREHDDGRHAPTLRLLCLPLVLCLLLSVWPAAIADAGDDDEDISDQILMALAPGAAIDPVLSRYTLTVIEYAPELGIWRVRVEPGANAETVAESMSEDPDVLWAEKHRASEAPEGTQRSIPDLGMVLSASDFLQQPALYAIRAATAQSRFTGHGTLIAVLDTGVAMDHPMISSAILKPGSNFLGAGLTAAPQPDGLDNDLDGLVDEALHHGTFVSGLIDVTAPGVTILPIRVLSAEGTGTALALARGIRRAVAEQADVINISVAMPLESEIVTEAIDDALKANVTVVAAVGNDGLDQVGYPARIEGVIAVAAVDANLAVTAYSNTGSEIAVGAPGEDLISTWGDAGLAGWSGTSFATPLVTGAVALLLEKYPDLTPPEVRALLVSTAQSGSAGAEVVDLDALTRVLLSNRDTLRVDRSAAGTELRFSPVLGATAYDVVLGDLAALRANAGSSADIDLGALVCVAENVPSSDGLLHVSANAVPTPGQGLFYLFRDDAGGSSYGSGSNGLDRVAGSGDCGIP